jgi:hypothetical protein
MQLRNSAQGYGAIPKSVQWFTVALVVVAWLLGTFGDDLPRGSARDVGMFVHVTAGLLIIALLVVRVLWRLVDAPPPADTTPLGGWIEAAREIDTLGALRAPCRNTDHWYRRAIRTWRCVVHLRVHRDRLPLD